MWIDLCENNVKVQQGIVAHSSSVCLLSKWQKDAIVSLIIRATTFELEGRTKGGESSSVNSKNQLRPTTIFQDERGKKGGSRSDENVAKSINCFGYFQ